MVLLISIIFLALGISLAVVWSGAVIMMLKGIVPLLLLFLGAILLLVGYSERKAKREYDEATGDATGDGSTPSSP